MKTAIDTGVLLELLAGDHESSSAARELLADSLSLGPVVICPVVYAELGAVLGDPEQLDGFLDDLQIRVEQFSNGALFHAATAWKRYVARWGGQIHCSHFGHKGEASCPACGAHLTWQQHILADFLVGGHASRQAGRLATRDSRYYRSYFPDLTLAMPSR